MKRASYQNGSVVLRKRKRGPDIWVFRYADGDKERTRRIGTIQKYRTKAAAEKAVAALREEINDRAQGVSIAALCDRFEKEDLDVRAHTRGSYLAFLRRVKADLGSMRIADVAADIPALELWVNSLTTLGRPAIVRPAYMAKGRLVPEKVIPATAPRPLAKTSRRHVKAFLHLLFEYAMKHGLFPLRRNPVELVRVKGKHTRVRVHTLLIRAQFEALMADPDLPEHVRVMIQIAMLLGLRVSEILGLRWDAIDFEKRILRVQASSVGKHADDTKTLASAAELPMHEDVETLLRAWKQINTAEDGSDLSVNGWLFGNLVTGRPFWSGIMQQDYLVPAGRKEGVGVVRLGWHDFRHTYRAMMGELDIPLEMQQKLMRHSDIGVTMRYGGQRSLHQMREHQAKVVEMLRRQA